jgi:hypothetical protein
MDKNKNYKNQIIPKLLLIYIIIKKAIEIYIVNMLSKYIVKNIIKLSLIVYVPTVIY